MNTTAQPKWKCISQLGDANPTDYGGHWVFIDETGQYPPEAEVLVTPDDEDGEYTVYRYALDPCTYRDGILSDNPYHPTHAAWFAKPEAERKECPQDTTFLSNVADFAGLSISELIAMFTSDDPVRRAEAYRAVSDYHGLHEFDSSPLQLTRKEVKKRYRDGRYKIQP